MRFATYNINQARGADGRRHPERIAAALDPLDLDVVGLQEVRRVLWIADQDAIIASRLGMQHLYGRASSRGFAQQGNAIVTLGRLIGCRVLPLPYQREPRSCLVSEIEMDGARLNFAVTHLPLSVKARAEALAMLAAELPRDLPLVLAGDMNASAEELAPLREWLEVPEEPPPSFPSESPARTIDHIAFSRHWRLDSLQAARTEASDHLPIIAELTLVEE